jgi:RIO-like serine/threonine protein kinase
MDLNIISVNNIVYNVIELLGKGKGGYSYLVKKDNSFYVVKQIHHEPCSYYTFGNKLESEINDYKRLLETGINIPELIEIDYKNERILKEYIEGPTVYDLVKNDSIKEEYIEIIRSISIKCKDKNLNIDYYPTNFIVKNDNLYYIDYECNIYDPKWNLENWGIKYWSKTEEFLKTLK